MKQRQHGNSFLNIDFLSISAIKMLFVFLFLAVPSKSLRASSGEVAQEIGSFLVEQKLFESTRPRKTTDQVKAEMADSKLVKTYYTKVEVHDCNEIEEITLDSPTSIGGMFTHCENYMRQYKKMVLSLGGDTLFIRIQGASCFPEDMRAFAYKCLEKDILQKR